MYEFAWRSPQMSGRLGAAHAVEIPFVFDTLGLGTGPMLGRDPPQPPARGLGGVRRPRRLRLAQIRCRPQASDAFRHGVSGGGQSCRPRACRVAGRSVGGSLQ
jgi:hypothetical protein